MQFLHLHGSFSAVFTDGMLHMMKEDQLRLVLRNKQQVEAALMEYHNELNHLDVRKCLRLLNERCCLALAPCFIRKLV